MSHLDYLRYFPSVQLSLDNLPVNTLNSPMIIDITSFLI